MAQKWRGSLVQCVGDKQPHKIEHWYTALWAYNSLSIKNNPSNPNFDSMRPIYDPFDEHRDTMRPYQEKVFGWMEHASGEYWPPVLTAYPDRRAIAADANYPPALPEPSCAGPTNCAQSRQTHDSLCIGRIEVKATLDGAPWPTSGLGSVEYLLAGPSGVSGTRVPVTLGRPEGIYQIVYTGGGPAGATLSNISPVPSQYLFAGGTTSFTLNFTSNGSCQASAGTGAGSDKSCATLSVELVADPSSASAPLNDVSLTASVGGTATGPIDYTFYCNRSDDGTSITPGYAVRYTGISTNPKTAASVCDYSSPGTYSAKVIVKRGSQLKEARRTITVGTSSASAPEVTTLAATSVTQASVTFNATVHPKSSATTYWFDYGTSTSVSQSTAPQTLAAATSQSAVSLSQSGLSCGQPYFYRVRASNAGGPAVPGDILSFTTDACGSGGSNTVQLVADPSFEAGNGGWWVANPAFYIDDEFNNPRTGDFYAYLSKTDGSRGNNLSGGFISPSITIPADATDADLRFWYSITSDETSASTVFDKVDVYLVRPPNQLNLITTISNLDENGTSYDLESEDLSSSFYGDTVQIFFAGSTDGSLPTVFRIDDVTLEVDVPSGGAPSVTTQAADQITASSARLNMTVDPNGADTTVWFDLEAGDSTPDNDTEHLSVGSGSQGEEVSISAFGLACGTLYYFRANAENDYDSDQGSVRSFTTPACSGGAPNADTDPAENITQTSATLTADVDPNGLLTQAWFAWGDSPSLGQETSHLSVGSGTGSVDFSQTLSGLTCNTTYYFENHASNAAGEDDGATLEFTTAPCDSGGPPAQGFFLDFRRQGCSGGAPAVLLWWTAPSGMGSVFTVRRADGGYAANVDSSQDGMVHLVSGVLAPGETYSFYVEGTLNGATVQTNAVTVPVLSDECRLPVSSGELPHLPLLWAGTPFCSGGTASVELQWTAVGGADSYTLTRIDNDAAQLIPYPNLAGTSRVDTGLVPGAEYQYMLEAVGSGGSRYANRISVFVRSGICGEPSTPGPFSAQVSTPVCDAGKGAVTVSWTAASGAASGVRTYWSDDGVASGTGRTFTGSSHVIDGLRPGALVKLMVQAEATSTPRQYRSIIMAQHVPLDVCGGGTLPPAVTTTTAPYIQEGQALLHATIVPNADSSTAFFEWGTTTSYGSTTPVRNTGSGYRSMSLGEVATGLACGTTYHFRAVAVNANGRTNGAGQSFTTPPCDPTHCSVSIVSPAGGETWTKSTPQTVRWTASPGCLSFSFRLLRGGLHNGWIDTQTPITGTEHEWTPAAWLIPGSNLQLEVAGYNAAGHGTAAISNNFSLVNPAVLPPLLFEETVETEMSNWHSEGWGVTNSTAHSPTHSRTDSPSGLYENNANRSLYPPLIDISGRQSVFLTFWERHDFANFDSGNVWVSADGEPFIKVRSFIGTQLEWRPITIDLAQFIGHQTIQIAFQLYSDASLTADGWYIDDIWIGDHPIFSDGFESGDKSQWLFTPASGETVIRELLQGQPGEPGKDIWTTSVYSYTPTQGTPGGGLDDDRLRVGGWADLYYSLIEFDLSGLPQQAQSVRIELFPRPQQGATGQTELYLDRITESWDWRIQGTGNDRERLWWADRPDAVQWRANALPAPTTGQWYSIDITELYNAWQAGTYPNHGVQLRPLSSNNNWAEFYSASHADPSLRPRLVIEP